MRLLLDTHAFLWFILDDPKLSERAKALIADGDNAVEISPASYWGIAIKISLGKYALPESYTVASRERLEKLKKLVSPADGKLDIDRKVIAVLVKADQPEFFNILISLYDAVPGGCLDDLPPAWEEMGKYGVQGAFWDLVTSHFGYRDEAPTLQHLLIRLLVSDLAHACRADLPDGLKHLRLARQGTANAVVCLA